MKELTYKLTGTDAATQMIVDATRKKYADDNSPFDRPEWELVQVMASEPCAAWVVKKTKILRIAQAMFSEPGSTRFESVPGKRRMNSAFNRLVRAGFFIRTMPSINGKRETHYEMNQGLFDKS